MQTASGQAVKNSSNRNTGQSRGRSTRKRRVSPIAMGIAAFLFVISIGVMGLALSGIWPPKSDEESKTVAQQWLESRTATPSTQYLNELKIEKVGQPRHEPEGTETIGGKSEQLSVVTVTLKVTNNIMMPEPNHPNGPLVQANLLFGTVRVLFYNVENSRQKIVGGGSGTVTDLKYGESKTIDVVAAHVEDYTDATQYDAFPDSIWTDKDAVKQHREQEARLRIRIRGRGSGISLLSIMIPDPRPLILILFNGEQHIAKTDFSKPIQQP